MYSPEDDYFPDEDFYYPRKSYSYSSSTGFSQASTGSRSLATAREANEHLQRLHRRVTDLEEIIRNQGIAINEKEAGHRLLRSQLRELKDIKERQVKELSLTVSKLQEKNRSLDDQIRRKSEGLDECHKRLILLDKLLSTSLPAVEKLVSNLRRFSVSNTELVKEQQQQILTPVGTTNGKNIENKDLPVNNNSADISAPSKHSASSNQTLAQQCVVFPENTDSGHPSSASDSYNVAIEEAGSPQIKSSNDTIPDHGTVTDVRQTVREIQQASSPRKQRGSHPKVHRNNIRKSNPLLNDSIANELTFGKASAAINNNAYSGHQQNQQQQLGSPYNTPPTSRREFKQQSYGETQQHKIIPMHSYNGSKYVDTSSLSGISRETPAENLASDIGTILNFSDGEGSDVEARVKSTNNTFDADADPPAPAPPPSTNPGNYHLPSIQAPKRFLPLLRY